MIKVDIPEDFQPIFLLPESGSS